MASLRVSAADIAAKVSVPELGKLLSDVHTHLPEEEGYLLVSNEKRPRLSITDVQMLVRVRGATAAQLTDILQTYAIASNGRQILHDTIEKLSLREQQEEHDTTTTEIWCLQIFMAHTSDMLQRTLNNPPPCCIS